MIYMIHKQKLRFYWLSLHEDLFGTWCVRKVYGGLRNNHSRDVLIPYVSKSEASLALSSLESLRRTRGYVYADVNSLDNFALTPQTINDVLES